MPRATDADLSVLLHLRPVDRWVAVASTGRLHCSSTALQRQHLGLQDRFLPSHSSVMYPMRSYKRQSSKSSSEEGITTPSAAGTTNSRGGAACEDARKHSTLESMALSLHACSSSSLRRLRPAVPPIATFRARIETVAVIRSAGTRTSGSNRGARIRSAGTRTSGSNREARARVARRDGPPLGASLPAPMEMSICILRGPGRAEQCCRGQAGRPPLAGRPHDTPQRRRRALRSCSRGGPPSPAAEAVPRRRAPAAAAQYHGGTSVDIVNKPIAVYVIPYEQFSTLQTDICGTVAGFMRLYYKDI